LICGAVIAAIVVAAVAIICFEFIPDDKLDADKVGTHRCVIPSYEELLVPASCTDLTRNSSHPNAFWDNGDFLCRLDERPCASTRPGNGYVVNLANRTDFVKLYNYPSFRPGDDGNVWVAIANTDESGCFGFRAEGHWYVFGDLEELDLPTPCDGSDGELCELLLRTPYTGEVAPSLNDYEFDSLKCCEESRVYIIIDGVLVDSCPKDLAKECRTCEA
jgi:hypothetical protein